MDDRSAAEQVNGHAVPGDRVPEDPARVYLGLGSNLGDREAQITEAIERLDAISGVDVQAQSAFLETKPWGKTDQPAFINAVIAIDTCLSPQALLDACLRVETALGRVRDERWGPRTIDIDILVYADWQVQEAGLTIPHPHIGERDFVLDPLAELAPDLAEDFRKTHAV